MSLWANTVLNAATISRYYLALYTRITVSFIRKVDSTFMLIATVNKHSYRRVSAPIELIINWKLLELLTSYLNRV